jgi:hypothetical protein
MAKCPPAIFPASQRVGNVKSNDPSLIGPIGGDVD